MDQGSKLLSDLVFYRTYSATKSNGLKETRKEMYARVFDMHRERFPQLIVELDEAETLANSGLIVPSMRSCQFAGDPIKREATRLYNCAFTTVESFQDIAEIFFVLMNGTGCGYSTQVQHISKLPKIEDGGYGKEHVIADNKEAWCDSIVTLLEHPRVAFNYSNIRPNGSALSSGGTASGPEALIRTHEAVRRILLNAISRQLSAIEVHDIICHVADGVVVGGVRRAALINLFSWFDKESRECKQGEWWNHNPQRARANNSAVIHRNDPLTEYAYNLVMDACFASNAGEPGIHWTNNLDYGTQPCHELSLRNKQFCNLTEVNAAACKDKAELMTAVWGATLLGTLQATYDNFGYLSKGWKVNAEQERLLGVSITGIAENWELLEPNFHALSKYATYINTDLATELCINTAARIGCVKPSGTTSAFLGTTSGVHAAHDHYYLRRVRVDTSHPIAQYLRQQCLFGAPETMQFIEYDKFNQNNIVVTLPINKEHGIVRTEESAVELLERAKIISDNWIRPSHNHGPDMHNVSMTVTYKEDEIADVKTWMWENRNSYAGVSLLPHDNGSYVQAPFESVNKQQYEEFLSKLPEGLDFSNVVFGETADERLGESACAGGACEVT